VRGAPNVEILGLQVTWMPVVNRYKPHLKHVIVSDASIMMTLVAPSFTGLGISTGMPVVIDFPVWHLLHR